MSKKKDAAINTGTYIGDYFRKNPMFAPQPSPYQAAVLNLARFIRSPENQAQIEQGDNITAFHAATVLGLAFGKDPEQVVIDLVDVESPPMMTTMTSLDIEKLGKLATNAYLDIEKGYKESWARLYVRRGAHLLGLLKKEGLEVRPVPKETK